MATLGTLLPFPEDSALTKDKISVIRLTSAYLKFQKFLQDGKQPVFCLRIDCVLVGVQVTAGLGFFSVFKFSQL